LQALARSTSPILPTFQVSFRCQWAEIRDLYRFAAVSIPPNRDEGTPGRALGVRFLVEVRQVLQESGYAGGVEDAAHNLCPALEHAERLLTFGPASPDPSLHKRQRCPNKLASVGGCPGADIGMAEFLTQPRLIDLGVEPDTDRTPGDLRAIWMRFIMPSSVFGPQPLPFLPRASRPRNCSKSSGRISSTRRSRPKNSMIQSVAPW
jgi:hypothetical protein